MAGDIADDALLYSERQKEITFFLKTDRLHLC